MLYPRLAKAPTLFVWPLTLRLRVLRADSKVTVYRVLRVRTYLFAYIATHHSLGLVKSYATQLQQAKTDTTALIKEKLSALLTSPYALIHNSHMHRVHSKHEGQSHELC